MESEESEEGMEIEEINEINESVGITECHGLPQSATE